MGLFESIFGGGNKSEEVEKVLSPDEKAKILADAKAEDQQKKDLEKSQEVDSDGPLYKGGIKEEGKDYKPFIEQK